MSTENAPGSSGAEKAVQETPSGDSPAETAPGLALVDFDTFSKIQLRTAEIMEATCHPKADRLLILKVRVGERVKQIVAGIRNAYAPETLPGKTIVIVDNLKPARLRGEQSEGMLLAVRLPDGGLSLLTTDSPAPSGLEVS